MLGREKFIIGCAPERSGKGVIDRDAKRAAFEHCPNIDFPVIARLLFAGVYGILNQVAEQDGNIGIRNENIAGDSGLDNVVYIIIFRLLREIKQHGIGGGILAETNERIVRQAAVITVEIP